MSKMDTVVDLEKTNEESKKDEAFKKPVLIGKVGKLPRKTVLTKVPPENNIFIEKNIVEEESILTKKCIEVCEDTEDDPINEERNLSSKESINHFQQPLDKNITLPYIEPQWSTLPVTETNYAFEVLKSGVIIENINLMKKPYWVFGRLETCDISMAHPTISRFHAILQYKGESSEDMPSGFYVYDLGSTHGTFLNKNRIKQKIYVRMQVGHMLKLGCSTRTYLLTGPEEDTENESEMSITELRLQRAEELKLREEKEKEEIEKIQKEKEKREREEQQKGIDWGMGEDADEETDLTENPYAETSNEQLYLDDPKKTLRGFMEREGVELQYDVTERGMGQFLCTVVLPVDDPRGRPIVAEALVKGKKKEAVVQCALEACRILDRHGLLRQATHESKKRKAKNWEENDYYDSDEDTFLDRTGTIEKKREKRMKAKQTQQPETYQSLIAKEETLKQQIKDIENQLTNTHTDRSNQNPEDTDTVDSLDSYMEKLTTSKPDKYTVGKLKNELVKLRKDHTEVLKLINLTRPTDLPPLASDSASTASQIPSSSGLSKTNQQKPLPMYGKRLKVKVMLPAKEIPASATSENTISNTTQECEEENDSDTETPEQVTQDNNEENPRDRKGIIKTLEMKMLNCDREALASLDKEVKAQISKTVNKLRKIAEEEESIVVEEKRLAVQKRKILEQVNNPETSQDINKHMKQINRMTSEYCAIGGRKLKMVDKINKLAEDINKIAVEIKIASKTQHEKAVDRMKEFVEKVHHQQVEIYNELKDLEKSQSNIKINDKLIELHDWLTDQKSTMLSNLEKLKTTKLSDDTKLIEDIMIFEEKSDFFIKTILVEIRKIQKITSNLSEAEDEASSSQHKETDEESAEKRRRKNMRRTVQRQERAEEEKKKQYEEDARKEDYNMWLPPENQSGDGRTCLNDKYGY